MHPCTSQSYAPWGGDACIWWESHCDLGCLVHKNYSHIFRPIFLPRNSSWLAKTDATAGPASSTAIPSIALVPSCTLATNKYLLLASVPGKAWGSCQSKKRNVVSLTASYWECHFHPCRYFLIASLELKCVQAIPVILLNSSGPLCTKCCTSNLLHAVAMVFACANSQLALKYSKVMFRNTL